MSIPLLSRVYSAGLIGIESYLIDVEVHIRLGMPQWITVGLPESAVKESKERVISAVQNCSYDFPYRKITINLAPADVKKEGTAYDLPIALALLRAAGMIPAEDLSQYIFVGELALNGDLRPCRGVLSFAILAKKLRLKGIVVPAQNYFEAKLVEGIEVYGIQNLSQIVEFLTLKKEIIPPKKEEENPILFDELDYADVKGQSFAKRALEVAATGMHHILLEGSPGSGKTMLTTRLPSILPPLAFEEALTTTQIYSLSGLIKQGLIQHRPFRASHHTISDAGLIGGGSHPKPGEVSLAHHGVLFLDELPEFHRNVLEALRQPIESGQVTISRASQSITYPARFLLAAAMNPCPCGQAKHPSLTCQCGPKILAKYQRKLSGPLLDRVDLKIDVPPLAFSELTSSVKEENSEQIRVRVLEGQERQRRRLKEYGLFFNSQMGPKLMKKYCALNSNTEKLLELVMKRFKLSARAFNRCLKVARTIADLRGEEEISEESLSEAIQYRFQ